MPEFYLRRRLKPALHVFAGFILVACATVPQAVVQPIKSTNDDYQYRLLTLANQLQVLLISAPGTPKAAASLDVMVGSGDNPAGRGGLAHFLEHMLFLGTDKYPDPAEYEEYITEHGGNRNAYTSFENTNYFFDVNAAFLPEALDRFAQFFIAPRFDEAYVDREKKAVEAEYQMGLKSDSRRGLDVLQEVMNPEHPFSQFSIGSQETLADRPDAAIRDDLVRFYNKHYSANMMRLAVLGSQSLDELEAMVAPMFSPVPNTSLEPQTIQAPLFAANSLPLLVRVQPQATMRQLEVSFPIPEHRQDYRVNPVAYLSNLVGHEGEGSLLSRLKREGLAESLAAGTGLTWRGGALFSVDISLTEKGVADYQHVLQLLFAYMDMLKAVGPKQWLYDEQSRLADLHFRFREKVDPMGYVSSLASSMQLYAPEDVLRGSYVMDRYDQPMLNSLLQRISADNALVVLTANEVQTDLVSKYYQVPYTRTAVTQEQLAIWRDGQAGSKTGELHPPEPNKFIADDVSLVTVDPGNPAIPAVDLEQDRQKIWFRQDDQFRVPKGATYINFRSPEVGQNAIQTAAAVLYTELLKDEVNEYAYPASLAGLSFDIYKHAQGISLRMSGYNDKQAVLLAQLLATIARPDFDPERFENIRLDMIRSLQNAVADRPSNQVMNDLREALLYGEWGEQALIAALQQLDMAGVQDFAGRFWAGASAETMIYGNYRRDYVNQVATMIAGVIPAQPAPPLPELKVLKLAAGESLQYSVDVPHNDSVVAWYLQGGANTWRDRAATALTAQITKSGFFQQLRTDQQLGYVVASFAWPQMEVPGLVMLIQSPVASAEVVEREMQSFLQRVPDELDAAQFARHREALLQEILRPDKNMWERADFYWQSIATRQWQFDGRQQLAAAVEAFTLKTWLDYYQRVFLTQRHSLEVVAPGRWGKFPRGKFQRYDSADEIKAEHKAYVIN